jgi:hypothetical protein
MNADTGLTVRPELLSETQPVATSQAAPFPGDNEPLPATKRLDGERAAHGGLSVAAPRPHTPPTRSPTRQLAARPFPLAAAAKQRSKSLELPSARAAPRTPARAVAAAAWLKREPGRPLGTSLDDTSSFASTAASTAGSSSSSASSGSAGRGGLPGFARGTAPTAAPPALRAAQRTSARGSPGGSPVGSPGSEAALVGAGEGDPLIESPKPTGRKRFLST